MLQPSEPVKFVVTTRPIRWNNQKYISVRDLLLALQTLRADLHRAGLTRTDEALTVGTIVSVLEKVNDMGASDIQGSWEDMRDICLRLAGR